MKKTSETKTDKVEEMASEYRFDYQKAKPNRFAEKMQAESLISAIPEKETKSISK